MPIPCLLVSHLHWEACPWHSGPKEELKIFCGCSETCFQTPAFLAADWNEEDSDHSNQASNNYRAILTAERQ